MNHIYEYYNINIMACSFDLMYTKNTVHSHAAQLTYMLKFLQSSLYFILTYLLITIFLGGSPGKCMWCKVFDAFDKLKCFHIV